MPRDKTRDLINKLKDEERNAKKSYEDITKSVRESLKGVGDVPHDFILSFNVYTQEAQRIFNKIEEIKSAYG